MKLLDKLLDISIKKSPSIVGIHPDYSKRSLNFESRKKTAKKIEEDNKRIANRIVNKQPHIAVNELKKDFRMFMKLRRHMSRFDMVASRNQSKKSIREEVNTRRTTPHKYISPCLRDQGAELSESIAEGSSPSLNKATINDFP